MNRPVRAVARVLVATLALAGPAAASGGEPPISALTLVGPPSPIFRATTDACDGADVPDAPARAFRDADGGVVMFGLHWRNRRLRGPDLAHLKIDCRVVLDSAGNADPAAYNDRSWITATWTADGRRVAAILHHEYQANAHPGRCRTAVYMECWYNTLTAAASNDGGASFLRTTPPAVVAAVPFRQEVGQGRHRGFFNPSNIVRDGRFHYLLAATTGWAGQDGGACLFRSENPADPARWRAYDGTGFNAAFPDPYRVKLALPTHCKPVGPFPAPVGAVVRHRPSGAFLAVFQAAAGGAFPQSGFYWTTSRDLVAWDAPRLLLAGATLYDDACKSGGSVMAYPSLLDEGAEGRNFDDVGDTALLTYATMRVEGCTVTSDRDLVRRPLAIKVWP